MTLKGRTSGHEDGTDEDGTDEDESSPPSGDFVLSKHCPPFSSSQAPTGRRVPPLDKLATRPPTYMYKVEYLYAARGNDAVDSRTSQRRLDDGSASWEIFSLELEEADLELNSAPNSGSSTAMCPSWEGGAIGTMRASRGAPHDAPSKFGR
ncbi:hypothetical protein DCS_03156 [Drechmeria coniospora]|uniref:Uncharacterized protein n=1 Tax=Drechmeria coniospora TaxID=98403 RepID=A0A151GY51_DRECN|nr:hypothetical protein DCS_03156 [Drechmeria coniospora]KYK62011.1 hypothetical protein DCS_03156 [Drechmeria coniospora]